MTYKKNIPERVLKRWEALNPSYTIDFSVDEQCIDFLKDECNLNLVNMFIMIPRGMFKADLWRMAKLYHNSGTYCDVDLIPNKSLDDVKSYAPKATFISIQGLLKNSIFQAYMDIKNKYNPLLLACMIDFLVKKPFLFSTLGPTMSMYNVLKYNVKKDLVPYTYYTIDEVRINININTSKTDEKIIPLYYFPPNQKYKVELVTDEKIKNPHTFSFYIKHNFLYVTKTSEACVKEEGCEVKKGWEENYSCDIILEANETIYLFEETVENIETEPKWKYAYVTNDKKEKILDSRDLEYFNDTKRNGWD